MDPADAAEWDRTGMIPAEVREELAAQGFLGADLPREHGGLGMGPVEYGELCARIGAVCSSLRGLITVQGMVSAAVLRWGTAAQREQWLPALATGDHLAGFAATEREAGTDLAEVTAVIENHGEVLRLNGHKRWITFGQTATVFLVLATMDGAPTAVLVEADRPGVTIEPISGQLGMRAAQLADVRFEQVELPVANLLAPKGFGLSHVVGHALDHGRFTVAWGCVGMAEACVAETARHASARHQGVTPLATHQLVLGMIARAAVDSAAARHLCLHAAQQRAASAPDALAATVMAKYAAARAAASASQDAVQVHGAAGCAPDSRVGRFFRDAKVMQIIEGSEQINELHIADHVLRTAGRTDHG